MLENDGNELRNRLLEKDTLSDAPDISSLGQESQELRGVPRQMTFDEMAALFEDPD